MDSPNVPQAPGGRIRALGFRAIRRGAHFVAIHMARLPPSGRMTSSARWYYNALGKLDKLPRVWFYARSMAYPNLIAEMLSEPRIAGRLSLPWHVCLVGWNDGLDVTFSVEPKVNPTDQPRLDSLRRDVRAIAVGLQADLKVMSRHRVSQIGRALNAVRATARPARRFIGRAPE